MANKEPRLNPLIARLIAYSLGINPLYRSHEYQEDKLNIHLRINNRTLEEEYKLVQQKRSGLSARMRDEVVYRYEKKQ